MCSLISSANLLFAQHLPFENLRVRNGLPSNYITSFSQDDQGRLWIGTADGLGIYDGTDCTIPEWSLRTDVRYIFDIEADAGQGMWIAADGRLIQVKDTSVSVCRFHDPGQAYMITAVRYLPGHGIWAGGSRGIAKAVNGELYPVALPAKLRSVNRMLCDPRGKLWILNDFGLHVYDPETNTSRTIDTAAGRYFNANFMYSDSRLDIFVCTRDSSILQFRGERLLARHHLPGAQPLSLVRDARGSLWVPTDAGLYYCDGDSIDFTRAVRFSTENGLPSSRLNCASIYLDRVLWFGSEGNGVIRLEDLSVQAFPASNMSGKGIQDRHGRLWMTGHPGIWEYWQEGSQWRQKLHPRQKDWPEGYSYHIQATDDDLLWVSFQSGAITVFDISRTSGASAGLRLVRKVLPQPGLPEPDSFCFLIDRHDWLWTKIRVSDLGVLSTRPRTKLLRMFLDFHPDIRALYEDLDGSIWLGGYHGGVFVYTDSLLVRPAFRRLDDPRLENVRAFCRDRLGRMWIGTMDGVLVQDGNRWNRIDERSGLQNNRITALALGTNGVMWVGTQTGVTSIGEDLRSQYRHPRLTDSPVGACGVMRDGVVWAATAFGLSLYDPSLSYRDTIPPIVRLGSFSVNGSAFLYDSQTTLSYSENNVRIDVYTVSMRKAEEIRYQYRFIGIDSAWSTLSSDRSLSFPALRPGDYLIEIRAENAEHVLSRAPLRLSFMISPPVWQRPWFFPAIVAAIWLVFVIVYRARMRRKLETERIRTRIAADLHDDIGSGLTRIAMMSDVMMQQTAAAASDHPIATQSLETLHGTIRRTGAIARELVESMSDVVWSLDPRNETVGQLADRLRVFAYDITDAPEIQLDFTISAGCRPLRAGTEVSRTLLMIIKEALNNSIRHASATRISVNISSSNTALQFSVADNGVGFDPERPGRRSGLAHMEQRASSCGGVLYIASAENLGTSIDGSIPLA